MLLIAYTGLSGASGISPFKRWEQDSEKCVVSLSLALFPVTVQDVMAAGGTEASGAFPVPGPAPVEGRSSEPTWVQIPRHRGCCGW